MRKLIFIFGIITYIVIFTFAITNIGTPVIWNYRPLINSYTVDAGVFYLIMAFYGGVGILCLLFPYIKNLQEQNKKLSRNYEKSSIETEDSSDKIKVLESKIQTLEVALKEALKR